MDYESYFQESLSKLHHDGNYRYFADLKRHNGSFPKATHHRGGSDTAEVTVWCSNDYLGMGQNTAVIDPMQCAIVHI